MIVKYGAGNRTNYDVHKWLVEEESEIAQIPKSIMGSTVYVITTGESWMIDSKGKWHIMSALSEKEPIECNCVEELTIWGDLVEPTAN